MNQNGLKSVFALIVSMVFFAACGNFEEIKIGDPDDFKLEGFEENYLKVNIGVPVENPTIHNIKVTELDVKVFLNDKYIGKLLVDENVVIRRKSNRVYQMPVKIRLNNLLGTAYIMMNMKKGQKAEVRLEGEVTAKSLLMKRTIDFNETHRIVI